MNDKDPKQLYTIRYTLGKDQIQEFLNQLEDMQQDYLEQAVEASGYRDARELLSYIMEK